MRHELFSVLLNVEDSWLALEYMVCAFIDIVSEENKAL